MRRKIQSYLSMKQPNLITPSESFSPNKEQGYYC